MIILAEQVAEARRELALRKRLYPKWVKRGDMIEGQAEYYVKAMEAIVATLTRLNRATRH